MLNNFPESKCICGATDWWYRMKEAWQSNGPSSGNEWVCGKCHPSPDPLVRLKYRVIKGNYKLDKALGTLKLTPVGEREQILKQFHAGVEKLKGLNTELKMKGATECLYIEDGKKLLKCLSEPTFQCMVCPNNYWWEKELMDLDRRDHPEVWKE